MGKKRASAGSASHATTLENQVEALRARNEELLAELDGATEALRQALSGPARKPGTLPAVRQPTPSQQIVVWRRGR